MNVLALDTAGPSPGVSVLARGEIFEERLPPDRQASEELLTTIARTLARAAIVLDDCHRIALCSGPGSFTGLRVGLSSAWGLGRALSIPVEEVPTLEVLAEASRGQGSERVTSALDAGRGEVIVQEFSLEGKRARGFGSPRRISRLEAGRLAPPIFALPAELLGSAARGPSSSLSRALALAVAAEPRGVPETRGRSPRAVYSRPSAAEEKHGAS
jgi:tRNA threonylcarbamoyladenosine biosynthesis protein TsaB